MNREALAEKVGELMDAVRADPRWQQDDLSVSILGMLSYGYALMIGRAVMLLDKPDNDAAVLRCLTQNVGAAAKWSSGLVGEASASAFDREYHPAQHRLIGIGHSYVGVADRSAVVDNVFANIASCRERVQDV